MNTIVTILGAVGLLGGAGACGSPPAKVAHPNAGHAPLSIAADEEMLVIPAGKYIAGSTPEERQAAYDDFLQTSGADTARAERWFDGEEDRTLHTLPAFRIDLMPVTQAQYAEFVEAGHAVAPAIDEATWRAQGFAQDYATVTRFLWTGARPPLQREDHPVVLVTWTEAGQYCAWRGALRQATRRLPTAPEYEKASRGEAGMAYPWGNTFEPSRLVSAVGGGGDTLPAGGRLDGASPYGALDMAGNVQQWTATAIGAERVVKGSGWDDFAGLGRGAASRRRATSTRHVSLGFRCAGDVR